MRSLRLLLIILIALIAIAMTTVPAVRQHTQHVDPAIQHVSTGTHVDDGLHATAPHVDNAEHHVQYSDVPDTHTAGTHEHLAVADHDHVALDDIRVYAVQHFAGAVEQPRTFGNDLEWHDYELRWMDYSLGHGNVVRVFHITDRHDATKRSINAVETHVVDWQPVQ